MTVMLKEDQRDVQANLFSAFHQFDRHALPVYVMDHVLSLTFSSPVVLKEVREEEDSHKTQFLDLAVNCRL